MSIIPESNISVGRAAAALYLLIDALCDKGSKVLVPANVCYAAVAPIIYAGCIPVFCDVDELSGNVTCETVDKATENCSVSMAILPHMYGNPISDAKEVIAGLKRDGVICVEDCASALGASFDDGSMVGFLGDYAVYSTGYSKTVDVGFGGVLASAKNDVSQLESVVNSFPVWSGSLEAVDSLFSKIYRAIRNSDAPIRFKSPVFKSAIAAMLDVFVCSLSEEQKRIQVKALEGAESVIAIRRSNRAFLSNQLKMSGCQLNEYVFASGSVPWRFNFFLDAERRPAFVREALELGVPISDWYPSVPRYFGDSGFYPNAEKMEARILNLPLLLSESEMLAVVENLSEVSRRVLEQ